jgi:hypothetical protein
MRKIIFLSHDPGGYDVIEPVFKKFQHHYPHSEFYCLGPAARIEPTHAITQDNLFNLIRQRLTDKSLHMLVTGTSWGSYAELDAISLCKQAGIVTVSILDFWSNYLSRFRNRADDLTLPDYYIVMDELACREAIEAGVPNNIIRVLGHPGLDKWAKPSLVKDKDGNRGKRRALFVSQPLSELYGDSLGYTEFDAIEDCVKAFKERDNWEFYIRFHPKDAEAIRSRYSEYAMSGDFKDAVSSVDLVVGMSSMALLHSAILGKPLISYQPNLIGDDHCITNKLGITQLIADFKQLDDEINKIENVAFTPKGSLGQTERIFDGKSTERVYRFLESRCFCED